MSKKETINSLKIKLKQFGFNEPFTKDSFNLISHLLSEFIKTQKENISLKEEINILKKQNISLLDSDNIKNKYAEQIKILIDDKKKILARINELKENLEEKNKERNLLELNEEKNKNYIDFIKIENKNLLENEQKFKNKISDLLNQISLLKFQNQKNNEISKQNIEMEKNIKNLEEKIETLEIKLKESKDANDSLQKLLKEKNKDLRDGENNNILLRKDLDIMNNKLKDLVEENDNIKKLNKDLLELKNEFEQKFIKKNNEYEQLRTNSGNIDNNNKLIKAENDNLKYQNLVNEKKIYMANCEIQEMDKTIKYLKKNLEQIKLTNMNNFNRNNNNNNTKTFCCQCGCVVEEFDNKEYDINKLMQDNKALYKVNRELRNKLDKIMINFNSQNDININYNNKVN